MLPVTWLCTARLSYPNPEDRSQMFPSLMMTGLTRKAEFLECRHLGGKFAAFQVAIRVDEFLCIIHIYIFNLTKVSLAAFR